MARTLPLWKIKREARRLGQQMLAVSEIVTGPLQRARYRRALARELRVTPGAQPASDRVAIFVLFQPRGVAPSILRTCDHLRAKGYAVLAVSNGALSDGDRAGVAARVWRLIERPNFGYDFGGYREGLQDLEREGRAPEILIILNDSTWYPIHGDDDVIDRMEASPADVLGAQVFGRFDRPNRKGRGPMFGSYFLMFKRAALDHPAFRAFWADYRLSSNKEIVLRRGERALSDRLIGAGIAAEGIFSREAFEKVLVALPPEDLHAALRFAVCMRPDLEARRAAHAALAPEDGAWMDRARRILGDAADDKNYIGSVPLVAIRHMGMPFLKKNAERHYQRARRAVLEATAEGLLPDLDPQVRAELADLVARQDDRGGG